MTMRKSLTLAGCLMAMGALVSAQEPAAQQEEQSEPRHVIRVLENPYDLASFYRSSPSSGYWNAGPVYGDSGFGSGFHNAQRGRYPIASFYRQGGGGRYSAFWQSGYRARPALVPGGYGAPYCNTIGENGDLYLLAPTFLAPVGPLTGAFFK